MAGGLIDRLVSLFEGDRAVTRVAEDPVLSAELLLLFRMILADGEASEVELQTLRRICREAFDFDESGLDHVVEYLREFGYETSVAQSLAMFRRLDEKRKRQLAIHMAAIARADQSLKPQEAALLERTLKLLDIHDV